MKKIIRWMTEVFGPKAQRFAENPWIASVQETMVSAIPVMIISSFVTIISIANEYIENFPDFSYLSSFTMGLSSLMVAYLLPTIVLEKLELPKYSRQAGFMGAASFLAMSGASFKEGNFIIEASRVSASGMFVAIAAGLFTAFVMKLFSSNSIFSKDSRMPDFLVNSFDSMAPIMTVMVTVFVLSNVLHLDIYNIISILVSPLIRIIQSCFGMTLLVFLMSFFYSFGISPWLLNPVYYTVGLDALARNAAAVAAGGRPELVMTVETISGWTMIGGTGCTLTLCILFFLCRSAKLKSLGKTCIIPSLFNINEPIVYGAIVFNPLLMIPMWINAILSSVITYLVMKAGLVTIPYRSFLLWYVPQPLLPFMTNYDFRGVILVLALMLITAAVWYPFLIAYDRQCLNQEKEG